MAQSIGPQIVQDFGGFPTFDASGNLLGNLTSSQGQPPAPATLNLTLPNNATVPNVGGAAGSDIPQAAAIAGITGGSVPTLSTTGNVAGAVASNWFARGVVVILGFVFVAVGLSQFNRGQNVIRAVLNKRV